MIYNIRHDKSQTAAIVKRISEEKQLSQGWGGGRGAELDLRQEDFIEKTVKCYELATTRIPSNLSRMTSFQDGDILVTPHLPAYGLVSIHVVDGAFPDCYHYETEDDEHQNHRVRLKRSVGLDGKISIYNEKLLPWYAKLQWLRLPVIPIPDFAGLFSAIVDEMAADASRQLSASELDEFIDELARKVEDLVTCELRSMPPSGGAISFERLCERLLESAGYKIEARNQFDRQGGDIDLRCTRSRSDTSPFEGGDVTLFVQVKKHKGETDEWAVGQVIKMIKAEEYADGCVMSVADGYTESAREYADGNGIVLLNKSAICSQVLSLLSGRLVELHLANGETT